LERKLSWSERRASEFERERDEAKKALSDGTLAHYKLERAYAEEQAEHRATAVVLNIARVVILVLLVVVGLLAWRLLT
jgi:hypothetical protein